ncbi:hypothetical protein DSL72_007644 [Monilinia vaccinii-corymbosi]|uniref:Uncharacterized protein n=1 Tax=Monilinia vaccinii-corymbosi TaxID=61207 RepID=A0A8A3PIL0_9HELO|nr:hypothetical protein DSL72_007644 [Monilinia vaccinii-corymbosi]
MSGIKETLKSGWHPKGKDGKPKESWRGDFKGINQVAGWMGKGKDTSRETALEHQSRPLSSLKDPSSFGPPPKSGRYHGSAALSPPTSLSYQTKSDTGGLGAPIPQDEIRARQEAEEEERRRQEEEASKPKPPPMPYRANTTGLSVAHLPPPPGRKDGADGRIPSSTPITGKPKPPCLPPRLPPRKTSSPTPTALSPPPTYGAATAAEGDPHKGILNQGALNRLGAAGISVPGFGIGSTKSKPALPPPSPRNSKSSSPPPPPARTSSPQIPPRTSSPQVNELQSRFSKLTSSSSSSSTSSSSPNPPPPTSGTTFAQKQAALKTASAFHKDPTSVSLSDARAAASTANNFRERHGEQVKSGWASANKLNTKYGIAEKVGSYGGVMQGRNDGTGENVASSGGNGVGGLNGNGDGNGQSVLGKKKPAPPPLPKKKLELGTSISGNGTPPPIPMATKPKPR